MMFTMPPQDFIDLGFRMNDKGDGHVCDLTVLGDVIGGQYIMKDFTEARDYQYMNAVIAGIRAAFAERAYVKALGEHVRGSDDIKS